MATFTVADLTLGSVAVMRILGIDPGTQVVGFGCLEVASTDSVGASSPTAHSAERPAPLPLAMRGSNVVRVGAATLASSGVRLVHAGVLQLGPRGTDLAIRLLHLADRFRGLVADLRPDEVALEQAFYGKSVQAALRIGEARGVVLAAAAACGLDVHQYAPARVKRCVTGHGAAAKQSVSAMMAQWLPAAAGALRGLPADATDALAVAWTRLEERRRPALNLARSAPRSIRTRTTSRTTDATPPIPEE